MEPAFLQIFFKFRNAFKILLFFVGLIQNVILLALHINTAEAIRTALAAKAIFAIPAIHRPPRTINIVAISGTHQVITKLIVLNMRAVNAVFEASYFIINIHTILALFYAETHVAIF